MTAQTRDQLYPTHPTHSMSLAMAQARIADLRAAAEQSRQVRAARGPRRALSWPVGVAAALRDSLAGALPASGSTPRRQTCTTC